MKILLTNIKMDGYNGTTMYIKELAISLIEKGKEVEVYTRIIGEIGLELIEKGVNVVTSLKKITFLPDIIHAHHNITTFDVLFFFKNTPVIFWIHDRLTPYDFPPFHKNIIKYMAVDYNCKERYTSDVNFLPTDTEVLYNWVSLKRFKLKENINIKPKKALVFSNYANDHNFLLNIKKACEKSQLKLDVIGKGSGNQKRNPEKHLANYDIIFAKAKAAMESITTGASVIICDFKGLAGLVTNENYEHYRKFNFGMKLMKQPPTEENIVNEINKYDAEEIKLVSKRLRSEIDIHLVVKKLLTIYEDSISSFAIEHTSKSSFKLSNFIYIKMITFPLIISLYLQKKNNILFIILSKLRKRFNN